MQCKMKKPNDFCCQSDLASAPIEGIAKYLKSRKMGIFVCVYLGPTFRHSRQSKILTKNSY